MKILSLAIGMVLISTIVTYAAETNFRQTSWGMSTEEVKAIEGQDGQDLVDESLVQTVITYERWVASSPVRVVYVLLENKLVNSLYLFTDRHSENALYLEDYKKIHTILKKKYGPPRNEQETWLNDSLKGRPDLRRTAIATGQLKLTTTWATKSTSIEHALHGDKYEISHGVTYKSLAHKPAVIEALDSQHLKDF